MNFLISPVKIQNKILLLLWNNLLLHISAGMETKGSFSFSPLVVLIFCFRIEFSIAADTITSSQSLPGNGTITSQGGIFELGLFQPGKSRNYYLGIWYRNITKKTVVWVANREKPLSSNSSELRIAADGNLVLFNQSNIQIWSTNSSSTSSNSTVAVLLDTGNLVLRDGSNSSAVFWQSFDHPTDTLLPGGRIGFNNVTNEKLRLITWKNPEDPSPGIFALEMDTDTRGGYLSIRRSNQVAWNWHEWNSTGDFSFGENRNERHITYSYNNDSVITRTVLHPSGRIMKLIWLESARDWTLSWTQPKDQCQFNSSCGSFGICSNTSSPSCRCSPGFIPRSPEDWNLAARAGGCVRRTQLHCGNNRSADTEDDRFLKMPNMRNADMSFRTTVGSAKECKSTCLNDCSCTAYAYGDDQCSLWKGDLNNLQRLFSNQGIDLYLRLSASEIPAISSKRKAITGTIVGAVIGAFLGIVLVLIWGYRKRLMIRSSETLEGFLVLFSYKDLQKATNNFSEKLGSGSFGSVFRGTLPNKTTLAVKKLEGIRQGEKQFRMEVTTIGMIQHINLVRLRGFCAEGSQRLLVYDYMPNQSLACNLFNRDLKTLDWTTRYQIALGTARGLAYLHEECRECIIHCDIKPENVLLDAHFCPKVSDFGMAKLIGRDSSRVLTTMRGTLGYLAPEWASGVAITTKADVYSYGMMLFEIISGRKNTKLTEDGSVDFFPILAAAKTSEGDVLCLLDERLNGNADMEELYRVCKVACWCIQEDEACRPSMGEVVQALEGVLEVEVSQVPRSLRRLVQDHESTVVSESFSSDQSSTYLMVDACV